MKTYSKDYQSKVNFDNVQTLLKKAIDTWSVKAPSLDGYYAKELGDLFRYKSKKVMDTAYKWLFDNHQSSYFPVPAKWKEAIKYAEMMTSSSNDCGDWLTLTQVGESLTYRFITKLDKQVLDLVKNFEHSAMIDNFKAKNCWSGIRDDYTYMPNSLTAYVVEIFRKQFVILNNIPADLPANTDKAYCNSAEFRDITLHKGFVSLDLLRQKDVDELIAREQTRNEILKDSEFSKSYSPENVIKRLGKLFKMGRYTTKLTH